jgi:NTE family protein
MQNMKIKNKKIKIGLALGSGGAKGLSHVGVIKELAKNNIPIDYIAGTSIGALVGAHYALYKDVEKLEKLAISTRWRDSIKLFDPTIGSGVITGKKIENLINDWLDNQGFDSLKIPFTAVATDLSTGREVDMQTGKLARAVRASISVPVVFEPVKHDDRILADGGLCNPLPDDIVRQMGADKVVAVNLDTGYFENNLETDKMNLPSTSMRALNIMRYHLATNGARTADIILEPKANGDIGLIGWSQFFDQEKSEKIIKNGADTVLDNLSEIKNLLNNN